MRFHILGTGSAGCNTAFHLRSRHEVTLILRSQRALQDFYKRKNEITYQRANQPNSIKIGGFDTMVANHKTLSNDLKNTMDAVVVTTKAQHVTEAVASIKPYLTRFSTLILLQNGMGVVEELIDSLWSGPDEQKNLPAIIRGVNNHATIRTEPFSVQHITGWDNPNYGYFLAAVPFTGTYSSLHDEQQYYEQTNAVIQACSDIPDLNTKKVDWQDLYERMMRKLVVNCSLNALSGILESTNGPIIENPYAVLLIHSICKECAEVLPEMNATTEDLYKVVEHTAYTASTSKTSTFQDILAKRLTEMEYINGYIVRLAKERNIPAPTNQLLLNLLHAKEYHIQAS
ncbi:ketopantoate reductase PanE/ApbA C terminal-domain-containing protein [Circinella umbellata]|nr:ketopantoate reductase PanE/ApbA C terminal-domain-containing protein [Circinella umbellata]